MKYFIICLLGPIAFATHGIGKGKKITSHPSVKEKFDGM